jgi:hypothetical protein
MGQALLVDVDLDRGAEILRILDEAGLEVSVALWAVLGEYNDWRLLIASRQLDGSQLEAYGLVNDALRAAGFPMGKRPSIVILPHDRSHGPRPSPLLPEQQRRGG